MKYTSSKPGCQNFPAMRQQLGNDVDSQEFTATLTVITDTMDTDK